MDTKKFISVFRNVVREEIRNVIKEELTEILREGLQSTISEMKQPTKKAPVTETKRVTPRKRVSFEETKFSDILNETDPLVENTPTTSYAQMMNEEMETLKFSSRDAQGFGMARQSQSAPSVMEDPETGKTYEVDPVVQKALTRDYSALMGAINKKKQG